MGQALDVLHPVQIKPNSTGPLKDISPTPALILKFPVRSMETYLASATPSQDKTPSQVSTFPSPGSRSPRSGPVPIWALQPSPSSVFADSNPGSELPAVQKRRPQHSPPQGRAQVGPRGMNSSGSAKGSPNHLRSPDHGGDGGGAARTQRALPAADTGFDTRDTGRGERSGR